MGYDYTVPITTGGTATGGDGSGWYRVTNPYNTPCEVAVLSISVSAACAVAIAPGANKPPTPSTTLSLLDPTTAQPGMLFNFGAADVKALSPVFWPLPSSTVSVLVAGAGQALVCLIFRRTDEVPLNLPALPVADESMDAADYHHLLAQQQTAQAVTVGPRGQ